MPTPLIDDAISNIPFEFDNVAGHEVTVNPTNIDVAMSNPNFGTAALGSDGVSVDVTPKQPPDDSQTATITVTDRAASPQVVFTLDVTLSPDQAVVRGHFNTASITTRPIPAPGP